MRRSARVALAAIATVAAGVVPFVAVSPPAHADAPNLTSGFGITVGATRPRARM